MWKVLKPTGRSLQQIHSVSRGEDIDHGLTNDYDDFDISRRQFYFFISW